MMTRVVSVLVLWLLATSARAQLPEGTTAEQFGISHLCDYLGLTPDDITYRSDYTEPDSFRLEIIARLMNHPLDMISYGSELRGAHVKGQPEIVSGILFSDIKTAGSGGRAAPYQPSADELQNNLNLVYTDLTLNNLLSRARVYLDIVFPRSLDKTLAPLSSAQRKFLLNEFKQIIVTDEDEEFLSVEAIDSLEKVEEKYTEQFVAFASGIDKDPLTKAGVDCTRELMQEINALRRDLATGAKRASNILTLSGYLPDNLDTDSYLGRQRGWAVGGTGNDYYEGDYKFIIDFGGDDVYQLSHDPSEPHGCIIIDLGGDDFYRGTTDFTLGSGCRSVGLLLDFGGNDHYVGQSFSLGSAFFGFGLLYDAAGDDRYDGDTHVQGAGTFGVGLLIDEGGRDIYNAALYSQGFGFVQGAGAIYDMDGSDSYYAGGKYKDILRYEDHYLSLSQGFGYGLRPYMSGGLGAIVDLKGNDSYYSDIFAQAASYWWSLGLIYDSSGNDNYQCFQYGQGAATHMTLGILIDDHGSDVYFGKGLMQGCGHDYSCGLILDRSGNDTYTAYDLSQGAGSANGAGLQIDLAGDDRYFSKNPVNTQGYGNPRRDFGSIGLFIDLGGKDQYKGKGKDNYYWMSDSKWGGGMDIELNPPDSTEGTGE